MEKRICSDDVIIAGFSRCKQPLFGTVYCADQWFEAFASDLAETMGGEVEQEIVHPRVFVAGFLAHGSRLP